MNEFRTLNNQNIYNIIVYNTSDEEGAINLYYSSDLLKVGR